MRGRPNVKQLGWQCDSWNLRVKVGDSVEFHPIIGESEHRIHTTRTKAEILSGHTAVVWLNGVSGCVALDACVPVAKGGE